MRHRNYCYQGFHLLPCITQPLYSRAGRRTIGSQWGVSGNDTCQFQLKWNTHVWSSHRSLPRIKGLKEPLFRWCRLQDGEISFSWVPEWLWSGTLTSRSPYFHLLMPPPRMDSMNKKSSFVVLKDFWVTSSIPNGQGYCAALKCSSKEHEFWNHTALT